VPYRKGAAGKRQLRLFTKNTGLCEVVKDDVYRLTLAQCWKVKGLVSRKAKLGAEAPVNGGRNYDGPKVAKFLVG
jgi:hypothetical protein